MPHPADIVAIQRLRPRLLGYALALTADRHEAEDLTHDCLARALGANNRPQGNALTGWLFAILRNLHIDSRRRARRRALAARGQDGDAAPPARSAEGRMVEAIALHEALAALSPAHRQVLLLIDLRGCTYAEASRLLDVSPGTVMSRVARARAALMRALAAGDR